MLQDTRPAGAPTFDKVTQNPQDYLGMQNDIQAELQK